MNKSLVFISILLLGSCIPKPGKVSKVPASSGITSVDFSISISNPIGKEISVQYLGCGGLYIVKANNGVLVDPFFSIQGVGELASSVLKKGEGKKNITSDHNRVNNGWNSIESKNGAIADKVRAILVSHSHYDHLLDVPAFFHKLSSKPSVYVNRSGFYTCSNVIPRGNMVVLEDIMTTSEVTRPASTLASLGSEQIKVYPILADHNPHYKHIKVFDGSITDPIDYFNDPYARTRANDWLEGNTFAFLIDFLDANGVIELRLFVQSSSSSPPAGIPEALTHSRKVDVAFLGVASYQDSPHYPEKLLNSIQPQHIVWIHWEDFFSKKSKVQTVRATDVANFFTLASVSSYAGRCHMPWPGVKMKISY